MARDPYRMMIEHAHQVGLALFEATSGRLVCASPAFAPLVTRRDSWTASTREPDGPPVPERLSSQTGVRWQDLGFLAPDEARSIFQEALKSRQPLRLPRVRIGEAMTTWECSLTPVRESPDGPVHHVVVSAVDVTDQVRAREELELTDRLKDQFLSLASHELRTPLTPLSMYAEVLKRLLAEDERSPDWKRKMQEAVSKFQSQISHIARLIDDLVDMARLESDRLSIECKPVDLKSVLPRAREQSLAAAPAMPVRLHLPNQPARVMVNGDEGRLLQVVGNLLNNAMRHATGSDQIDLSLSVSQTNSEALARIEVRDNGPGIAPEVMETLFTRFSKGSRPSLASRSGLGLGLYISRGIVEQHGGTIRVRTEGGQGSTFTVELPLIN
jgi:signal transduction histidine kinase